jgi:hypothetical protein
MTAPPQLRQFEACRSSNAGAGEWLFRVLAATMLAAALALGLYSRTVKPVAETVQERITRIRTRFVIQEKPHTPRMQPPASKPARAPKPAGATGPVDLTNKPLPGHPAGDLVTPVPPAQPVRRVYGLRRVYSVGIGAGGSLADAVIGKVGNTLDKEVDTLKAAAHDLKGTVVAMSAVSSEPKLKKVVKPVYTPEMLDNRIEGVVRVRVTIGIDGKVKRAEPLNDLGYGSAAQAVQACLLLEFEPALRDGQPVATIVIVPIRFVLLG